MKKIIHNAGVIEKIQKEQRRQAVKTKARNGWNQIKDMILMLMLLNTLIGTLQKIDIMEVWNDTSVKTIVIENPHLNPVRLALADTTPSAPDTRVEETKATFTAYNAEPAQTDGDPFTMASGKKVYEGAIANNCLDFGTKVKINGKIKVVEDRMNSRYDCDHFDIFMASHDEAIKFGKQEIAYEVIK